VKLPKRIKIGPVVFDIVQEDKLLDEGCNRKLLGQILISDCLIKMEPKQHDNTWRLTLLHEIVHGISVFSGCELSEEQVDRITNLLGAVLLDNPKLVEMWRGKARDD